MRGEIPTGNVYAMDDNPAIEWIVPKTLVIVRVPEFIKDVEGGPSIDEYLANVAGNDNFKTYCFIVVHQEGISQIEFEYPKNACSCRQTQAISSPNLFMEQADYEKFMDDMKKNGKSTNL